VTTAAVVTLRCRQRMGDTDTEFISGAIRANGDAPIMARGRYMQPRIVYASGADWTYIDSFEIIGGAGGGSQ
jgi:hypothetical protein